MPNLILVFQRCCIVYNNSKNLHEFLSVSSWKYSMSVTTCTLIHHVSPWPAELQILLVFCAFYWSTHFWVSALCIALSCTFLHSHHHFPAHFATFPHTLHHNPTCFAISQHFGLPFPCLTRPSPGSPHLLYHIPLCFNFAPSFLDPLAPSLVFSTCIYTLDTQTNLASFPLCASDLSKLCAACLHSWHCHTRLQPLQLQPNMYSTWAATHRKLHAAQRSAQQFPITFILRLWVADCSLFWHRCARARL